MDMSTTWRTLDRVTLRDIALVCIAEAIVGVSFGAITVAGHMPAWVPIAMSVAIFAGGSQFAAASVLLAGGGATAAALAGLLINARLIAFGFTVADLFDGPWWKRVFGAHVMTDESVAFALRQHDPGGRRAAFWTCGISLYVTWSLATALGAVAGRAIGDIGVLGLDAAFPAVLIGLVLPSLADRAVRRAALIGAVVAVTTTPFLPAGLPVLFALTGLAATGRSVASAGAAAPPKGAGPSPKGPGPVQEAH